MSHNLIRGKSGTIEIQTGPEPAIKRSKSGSLLVVSISHSLLRKLFVIKFSFHRLLDNRKAIYKREELQCCALI